MILALCIISTILIAGHPIPRPLEPAQRFLVLSTMAVAITTIWLMYGKLP